MEFVKCKTGDQGACYYNSYLHETLETRSPEAIAASNPPDDQQTLSYLKRYSILRTELFDNRVVTTRMLCVYMSYPISTDEENCMPRTVITGPDAGNVLPFPSDDAN